MQTILRRIASTNRRFALFTLVAALIGLTVHETARNAASNAQISPPAASPVAPMVGTPLAAAPAAAGMVAAIDPETGSPHRTQPRTDARTSGWRGRLAADDRRGQADLASAINAVDAERDAPLSESLFQLYTYYMSRDTADLPVGKDGATQFPRYEFNTQSSGTGGNSTAQLLADPVQYSCQKHFIMIITDGDSTKDHFAVVKTCPRLRASQTSTPS